MKDFNESTVTQVVARKTYWRKVSVVMACKAVDSWPAPDHGLWWFEASWQRKWWGGYRLTLCEYLNKHATASARTG